MHHRVTRTIARVASAAMVAGAVAGASLAGTIATASPAAASSGAVSTVVSLTNAARAQAGLPSYQYSADLQRVAQSWADQMAARGAISHNPRLKSAVRGWRYVGENVGSGGSLQAIQSSFMKSASHRSNILDRDFTQLGVGVAVSHNTACDCDIYYVAVDFRQPSGSSTAGAPATKVAPKAPTKAAAKSAAKSGAKSPSKPAVKAPAKPATTPAKPAAKTPATQATSPAKAAPPTPSPTPTASAPAVATPSPAETRDPVTRALEFTAS